MGSQSQTTVSSEKRYIIKTINIYSLYENIFIKDTDKEKVKFIYAKNGMLINNADERVFRLFKSARKLSTSGAIDTINQVHQIPLPINLFFSFISVRVSLC